MNKYIESLKDMIYEAIDYIMIVGIIAVVGLIIGWRLDVLFKQDLNSDNIASVEVEQNEQKTTPLDLNSTANAAGDIQGENIDEVKKESTEQKKSTTKVEDSKDNIEDKSLNKIGESISIEIPSGSNSTDIGDILLSNGLISSLKEFNDKSEELGLSTKLKAGKFDIASGASLEEILNIITK